MKVRTGQRHALGIARTISSAFMFFDRIILFLDRTAKRLDIDPLREHCHGVSMKRKPLRARPELKYRLDLRQPDEAALDYLARHIEGDYLLSRAEIALDLLTPSKQATRSLHHFIEAHFTYARNGSYHFHQVQGTVYYAPRRASLCPVLYSDRPSKCAPTHKRPCVHLEYRLDCRALKQRGVYLLSDLLNFAFADFWREHLTLKTFSSAEDIGRVYLDQSRRGNRHHYTERWYKKTGSRVLAQHQNAGGYILLQQALSMDPALKECLQMIDTGPLLRRIEDRGATPGHFPSQASASRALIRSRVSNAYFPG